MVWLELTRDKGKDHLTMGYLDNHDNESSNEYKKNLKNRKKSFIDIFF
jgi:hypothetical protein